MAKTACLNPSPLSPLKRLPLSFAEGLTAGARHRKKIVSGRGSTIPERDGVFRTRGRDPEPSRFGTSVKMTGAHRHVVPFQILGHCRLEWLWVNGWGLGSAAALRQANEQSKQHERTEQMVQTGHGNRP
jgi:hypothetical protein